MGTENSGIKRIVGIDPAGRTGWAVFHWLPHPKYPWTLAQAGYVDIGGRAGMVYTITGLCRGYRTTVLIEEPKYWPGQKRSKPQDIIELSWVGGEIAGMLRWAMGEDLFCLDKIPARTWKGTVDKKIHNRRVLAKLTPRELANLKGKDHNMIDGVGLCLWWLERGQLR